MSRKCNEKNERAVDTESKAVDTRSWDLFRKRFKSPVTEASYYSDIMEFCRLTGKAFAKNNADDVRRYYEWMSARIREGRLSPVTVTKKFRELHSYAAFLMEEGGYLPDREHDYFYPYLKHMTKESSLAGAIPVEEMDALFKAASNDLSVYAILTLMYRAGLSSTEITHIRGEDDFIQYDDGVYLMLSGREEPCFIPQDAWEIVSVYMDQREVYGTLFYNRNGRPLNVMYISRMMKKYCALAGIRDHSAQEVRNCCAFNLFAYGATDEQTARQMGRTKQQIRRYRGAGYCGNLKKQASDLVRIRIEKP